MTNHCHLIVQQTPREDHKWGQSHHRAIELALICWRLGDRAESQIHLERASALAESLSDEPGREAIAFVASVSEFILRHDPKEQLPIPRSWPQLDGRARQWREGQWHRVGGRSVVHEEDTLLVQDHDRDTAAIVYSPVGIGTGIAWLGVGPVEDDPYDIEGEVAGLGEWCLAVTGARPAGGDLRRLLTPRVDADVVSLLTELCRVLGLTLPRS